MARIQTEIKESGQWGRAWAVELRTFLGCLLILTLSPLMVMYFYICAFSYDCSLTGPIYDILNGNLTRAAIWEKLPHFSMQALAIFALWLGLQLVLAIIPDFVHRIVRIYRGGPQLGAMTPAGNRLWYEINGLQAWIVSHVLFIVGAFWLGWMSPTILFDNWGSLLIIANVMGFSLGIFCYLKAYLFPSHPEDRKFSGNFLYDFYMGIELNPRIGPIDFKLFFNGRPGIIAWTLINLSFASEQYMQYGTVTNSMLLVNFFHALYVLYFFWKEHWYLYTIDIHHDHFGWMLGWGDSVWLPYMYTLQGLFLVFHPIELSAGYALFVLALGLLGFWLFLSTNNQKDHFKHSDGNIKIWKKPADYIECKYKTTDGETRNSKLLISGWWGIGRHMNYTGDLIFSLAISLACGMELLFPYFYFIYMTILLVHRCIRDEHRCSCKYGPAWEEYCKKVPYRFIPGVY